MTDTWLITKDSGYYNPTDFVATAEGLELAKIVAEADAEKPLRWSSPNKDGDVRCLNGSYDLYHWPVHITGENLREELSYWERGDKRNSAHLDELVERFDKLKKAR